MTPQEILKGFITDLQKSSGAETPEIKIMIEQLSIIEQSGDEKAITAAISGVLKAGEAFQANQPSQPSKVDLSFNNQNLFTEKPIVETKVDGWEQAKTTYNRIRQEYLNYKRPAMLGVKVGAIFLAVLSVIALFFSWDTTGINLINQSLSSHESNILKFFYLDYIFVCLMALKWLDFLIIAAVVIVMFTGEEEAGIKKFSKKFGVEALILFTLIIFVLENLGLFASSLLNVTFTIYIAGILSFLGWCAVWSLIIYFIFQRAKVGSEAKLYFTTFGIELIINTIRLYILFVILYIPIFIGAVLYVSSQGGTTDKAWTNFPFETAAFWGWWIPLIFGSLNLAMSLGIFFGWNAPISGIKLSFDSREMTSEEKDYMIGFYRRLVESGRSDERVFKSWNIIESSGVFAFTYGENIFISRGSFVERYFNALVAHEIGHLHQRDGLILQALHSFTYPLFNHLLFNPTTIQKGVIEQDKDFNKPNFLLSGILSSMTITFFTLSFGGWSVQALARFWSRFYINRDYLADDYALSLGFGYELLNYLESYKDFDTALPLFNRWRGYTRVRIERIKQKIEMSV